MNCKIFLIFMLFFCACEKDQSFYSVYQAPEPKGDTETGVYAKGYYEKHVYKVYEDMEFRKYYRVLRSADATMQQYYFETNSQYYFVVQKVMDNDRAVYTTFSTTGKPANMSLPYDENVIAIEPDSAFVAFPTGVNGNMYKVIIALEQSKLEVKK